MLKKLRHKKTSKRILIILAAVIIPAFAFWGFSSVLQGEKNTYYLGKIYGKKVSLLDFKEALDATKNMAILQYGDKFDQMRDSLNLEAQAWERMILLAEAGERKIKVSDKEVVQFIQSYPFFQKDNLFNTSIYNQLLQYVFRTQPRIFEEQTRQNLEISKLYKEITGNIKLTDQEIKEEYRRMNEQLSLSYISAIPQDFSKEVKVNDQELKAYYQNNSIQFKQPLSFNIEYVSLDKESAQAEEKIKALFSRLKKKEDFKTASKESGLEVKETGLFSESDPIPGIGWAPQITQLLAKGDAGKYLNPVGWDKNLYILKIKEKREPFIPELESIKDKVKEAYIKDKSKSLAKEKAQSCLNQIRGQDADTLKNLNFEQQAKNCGLKSGVTSDFKYGSYIEGIGASDIFWNSAQNLKDNEISPVVDSPSGYYIIKIKSRTPIDEKKFSEEKDKFSETLLLLKKQDYFSKFIEDLKRKAQRY